MVGRTAALVAVSALFIAGCDLGHRQFSSVFGQNGCRYKDSAYAHGSVACQSGSQYRCDDGQWTGGGAACTENAPLAGKGCDLNGNAYSAGSASCQSGTQYRCDDGAWRTLALACSGGSDVPTRGTLAGRTCLYNSATVAPQSTICKSGTIFLCEDGEWRNLGSACQ